MSPVFSALGNLAFLFHPLFGCCLSQKENRSFSFFPTLGCSPAASILLCVVVPLVKWTGRQPGLQLQPSGDVWMLVVKNVWTTMRFLLPLSDFTVRLVKCLFLTCFVFFLPIKWKKMCKHFQTVMWLFERFRGSQCTEKNKHNNNRKVFDGMLLAWIQLQLDSFCHEIVGYWSCFGWIPDSSFEITEKYTV